MTDDGDSQKDGFGRKTHSDLLSSSQFLRAEPRHFVIGGTDAGCENENTYYGNHQPGQTVGTRVCEENRTKVVVGVERAPSAALADINGRQYWSTAPFAPSELLEASAQKIKG